jgi:hypothetical protein
MPLNPHHISPRPSTVKVSNSFALSGKACKEDMGRGGVDRSKLSLTMSIDSIYSGLKVLRLSVPAKLCDFSNHLWKHTVPPIAVVSIAGQAFLPRVETNARAASKLTDPLKLYYTSRTRFLKLLRQSQAKLCMSYKRMVSVMRGDFHNTAMTIQGQSSGFYHRNFALNFSSWQRITESHKPTSFNNLFLFCFTSLTRASREF